MAIPLTGNKMRKIEKSVFFIFILLLVINFVYVLAGVLFQPIRSMDVIGMWLLKAKAIYLENGLPLKYLRSDDFFYSSQEYPLLLPAFSALIFKISRGIKETYVLTLYPFLYSAILVLVYRCARIKFKPIPAIVFTYLYSMLSPLLGQAGRGHAGSADIVIVFLVWSIIFLLLKKPLSKKTVFLLAFLIAFASQIKSEGVFLASLFLFLPLPKREKILAIFLSVTPLVVWFLLTKYWGVNTYHRFLLPQPIVLVNRVWVIIEEIARELVNVKNWYIFWPMVGLSVLLPVPVSPLIKKVFLPSAGIMVIFFLLMYPFSVFDTYKFIHSSRDRVFFQLSPLFFFYLKLISL